MAKVISYKGQKYVRVDSVEHKRNDGKAYNITAFKSLEGKSREIGLTLSSNVQYFDKSAEVLKKIHKEAEIALKDLVSSEEAYVDKNSFKAINNLIKDAIKDLQSGAKIISKASEKAKSIASLSQSLVG